MVFGSAFGPSPLEAPRDDNQSTVLNIWFENMLVGFLLLWMDVFEFLLYCHSLFSLISILAHLGSAGSFGCSRTITLKYLIDITVQLPWFVVISFNSFVLSIHSRF